MNWKKTRPGRFVRGKYWGIHYRVRRAARALRGPNASSPPPESYPFHEDRKGTPINPPELIVRDISPEMGRGVFAGRAFAEGETVEVAPIMLMMDGWEDLPAEVRVRVFRWGDLAGTWNEHFALPLGYGTFYNHVNDPNLRYEGDDVEQTITYSARRAIAEGEQLTIHYDQPTGEHIEMESSWFDGVGIEQVDVD